MEYGLHARRRHLENRPEAGPAAYRGSVEASCCIPYQSSVGKNCNSWRRQRTQRALAFAVQLKHSRLDRSPPRSAV